ncbi:H(+)/Cl(-) exchange transporter 7-like [Lycorma delicatula]|uniref:H(+)/Cl(-) exchange transporter 7-like n=1 Tax=Lycorma delicatula TaxID=130591 RepID=UPI003F5148FF
MAVGTFVPNLLIGAMWGRCYAIILNKIFPNSSWVHPKKYTFLASVAQLSGSLRLTFSITIIAVEITGNIQLLLPIMCSLLTAKWVGNLLSPRVFDEQVILHGIPILLSNPPPFACEIPVEQIMSKPVTTLPPIVEVNDVINTISMNNYQCYPVVSKHNSLLGSVTTKDILILLKYRIFLNTNMNLEVIERFFEGEFSKKITLKKLNLESKDFTQKLNLAMIMNPCPYVVKQNMSFERAYYLYRNLGLAQLIVVDYKYRVVGIIVRSDLSRHHPVEGGITRLPLL